MSFCTFWACDLVGMMACALDLISPCILVPFCHKSLHKNDGEALPLDVRGESENSSLVKLKAVRNFETFLNFVRSIKIKF